MIGRILRALGFHKRILLLMGADVPDVGDLLNAC